MLTTWSNVRIKGCSLGTVQNYLFIAWARIQAVSWKRCTFSNEILTFFATKNSNEFHVFLKFGQNFHAQIVKIFKIHWKGQAKATIIIPICPISESDKCQLRGRWGAVSSWKCYVQCIYFSLGGSRGQTGGTFIRKNLYPLHLFFFDCHG